MAIEHETPVLVVGAGPAGLIAALQLSRHGSACMLVERNLDTTKWPKMDITNCRSMELLRRLAIADGLRDVGVEQKYSFDVLFSTGLSDGGEIISKWDLPSPDAWRVRIKETNDGSMPREPYQRCSQAIFEAWLKPRIQAEPLIDSHFGLKFESLDEQDDCVISNFTDVRTGEQHIVKSKFVVGCDGGGSRVRRSIGGKLIGGPAPHAMYLVHFKSRDLSRLHRQGQFWHIFFSSGAVIISQDETDTWTTHLPVALDADISSIDPIKAIYQVLGGSTGPYPIEVDEVMVTSSWRPNICITDRYRSVGGRIFLSGDAAHQNIPTGGYGMNTALGDSFDIGWKLSAIIKGYAGRYLLDSYEVERRPVAVRNIGRSGDHSSIHATYIQWVMSEGREKVIAATESGKEFRKRIADHVELHDGENKDHGIEMGYRYNDSPVVVLTDARSDEPEWNTKHYIPSTWPGARAPHVFLKDGATSIYDHFGPQYTFVDFTRNGALAAHCTTLCQRLGIPIKVIHLPDEHHVHSVWGKRDAYLVRPDDHIAWRAAITHLNGAVEQDSIEDVLLIATGQKSVISDEKIKAHNERVIQLVEKSGFNATVGNVDQDQVKMLAAFQA